MNPYILTANQDITKIQQISSIIEKIKHSPNRNLLIFAKHASESVISHLLYHH